MNQCISCECELLNGDVPYMIEKALKPYNGFNSYSTVFEYAMCLKCMQGYQGDISDKSRQESKNTFALTTAQYQNLREASIKFIPYCSSSTDVGMLNLYVNNRNIYSAVPVCEDLVKQDIPLTVRQQ